MNPMDIFSQTAAFRRLKLLLGLGMTLLATLLYVAIVALPSLAASWLGWVLLLPWAALSAFLCYKLYQSGGWKTDISHIAMITGAITEGYIPGSASSVASDMVNARFHTRGQYLAAKHDISRAVTEINDVLTEASSLMGNIPGMKMMVSMGRTFLHLHLCYMTRACLGFTFFRGDEPLFLAGAEGVAVYAINWKRLVKKSADLVTLAVVAFIVLLTVGLGILFYFLMGLMGMGAYAYYGVLLAAMLAFTLKHAYLDTFFTVYYTHMYMHCAEYTEPSPDFYGRLCKMSGAYAKLWALANGKMPTPKNAPTFARKKKQPPSYESTVRRAADREHPVVCPRCKNANRLDAKFCARCGARLK